MVRKAKDAASGGSRDHAAKRESKPESAAAPSGDDDADSVEMKLHVVQLSIRPRFDLPRCYPISMPRRISFLEFLRTVAAHTVAFWNQARMYVRDMQR